MFILDKPYASTFLIDTIRENGFPVLENAFTTQFKDALNDCFVSQEMALKQLSDTKYPKIYTSSENSIGWIDKHLKHTSLPEQIKNFKDKVKFRELTAEMYPHIFYQQINITDIDQLNIENLPMPFVIKPAIGFFSMGVYIVNSAQEWEGVKRKVSAEIEVIKSLYPKEVLNTKKFIIEELIEGDEYAFDAYFNEDGKPVMLGIFKHYFASKEDVSDRVYYTSKAIVEENYAPFYSFLKEIGKLTSLRNFPMHIEMRKDAAGNSKPIEINPMRFGGWCTTADASYHAFGFNSYECFLRSEKPNWDKILHQMDDSLFSLIVLDNSSGVKGTEVSSFDYQLLDKQFINTLEIRKVDYNAYPVFGFVFTKTSPENFNELDRIVQSDLNEYIVKKQ